MKKIILLCNGGLSTGILVKKMLAAAQNINYDCNIAAFPVADAQEVAKDTDLILLGPQVRFQMQEVKKQVDCPVVSIEPMAYGTMNGEKVLQQVRTELGDL